MLKASATLLTAFGWNGPLSLWGQNANAPLNVRNLRDSLSGQMRNLVQAAQYRRGDIVFTRPCVAPTYQGTWPDDCMWPYVGDPTLTKLTAWPGLLQWLTDAIVDLPVVPDRVEFNDVPVFAPGSAGGPPLSDRMPLHLPSAWTRYLDYAESFGVEIPRKADWAQVIRRSFEQVPFSYGLVYSDPQLKIVGFGFHDTIRLTGQELMTSLITYCGLRRAAKLFKKEIEQTVRDQWLRRAQDIQNNLYRLFDPGTGGFLGASVQGRQFSVWGNGLAYWLANKDQKRSILKFYRDNKSKIFLRSCTRQVAEAGGWNGKVSPNFSYQSGGFWAAGTGFVLPALADGDPELAAEVAKDLSENLAAIDYAEWIDDKSIPNGARKFLASVSLPLIAARSISESRPLLQYL